MNEYKKAIHEGMLNFAKLPNSIFLGQQVGVTNFYSTLDGIPDEKRIELPVAEELQLGMSIGLAMQGYLPISIYQRMDFLPRACDQLVNHLDIMKEMSRGQFNPKVIIRTTIGSLDPLDTGLQHSKDLTEGFRALLKNIKVARLETAEQAKFVYWEALNDNDSHLIIEVQDLYNE